VTATVRDEQEDAMESNKEVVRRWFSAAGRGDGKTYRQLMTDDVVVETMGTSVLSGTRSLDEVVAFVEQLRLYTRDGIEFKITALTAEDDRVAAEATGRSQMVDGTRYDNAYHILFRLRDGKICRVNEYLDTRLVDAVVGPLLRAGG
jgi:uncharacterized protein